LPRHRERLQSAATSLRITRRLLLAAMKRIAVLCAILAAVVAGHGASAEKGKANASAVAVDEGAFLAQAKSHSDGDLAVAVEEHAEEAVDEGSFKVWVKGHRGGPDYNEETHITFIPISIECIFALLFIALISSVPILLVLMVGGSSLTKAHIIESVCLILWLGAALFLFTNIIEFNSGHWTGPRPLTTVEAVYLLSQILTTVGYGDITPAYARGQVWIALNVLLALLLYGSVILEVTELIGKRLEARGQPEGDVDAEEPLNSPNAVHALRCWEVKPDAPSMEPLMKSGLAFVFLASLGVCFYHFMPGEEKTWLQAVYMSVITLSTVGFGWFSAATEAGKVFGAFWMLFGVMALAALIGSFVEWMMAIKKMERFNEAKEKLNFYRWVKLFSHPDPKLGDQGMEMYDFMKFGLLMKGLATEEELQRIEERFAALSPNADGKVSYDQVYHAEGPPAYLKRERTRALAEAAAES